MGWLLLLFFVWLIPGRVGAAALPHESAPHRWWVGLWLLLSSIMVVGSVIYYLAGFSAPVAYTLFLLAIPVTLWLGRNETHGPWPWHDVWQGIKHHVPSAVFGAAGIILLALYFILNGLTSAATLEAIRSPWLLVSPAIFVAFGIAAALLATMLVRGRERALSIPLFILLFFTALSVVLFVYPLGYGFDGFIHRTTEQYIADHGSITPKPFYYIGQYVLILFFHHVFQLPIDTLDPWLLPILTSILLPFAWLFAANHLLPDRRSVSVTLLGLFLIPLSSFIVTTPQGLANLWILLLVLISIPILLHARSIHWMTLGLPVAAALTIHPLAGLPALLYAALLFLRKHRVALWITTALGAFLLPASFLILSILTATPLRLSFHASRLLTDLPALPTLENHFRPLLDFAYFIGPNLGWLLLIAALSGWWLTRKKIQGHLQPLFFSLGALLVNYFTLKTTFDFSFLIEYERSNYADRLLPLAAFFLAPFSMLGIGHLAEGVRRTSFTVRVFAVVLAGTVMTASWYALYPRHNALEIGHNINTSRWDIEAVRAIEKDANGAPYVVLANQAVSAAAIRVVGFRYLGDQFFYPIPTGGKFYEAFLRMNEAPRRETALEALAWVEKDCQEKNGCEAVSLKTIYYVVNDYWSHSKELIAATSPIADRAWNMDGHVFIFRFDRE